MLTENESNHYREQGFVIPAFHLAAERVMVLNRALDEMISANPGKPHDGMPGAHIVRGNPDGIIGHESFLALARDEGLLDMVEGIIGKDIVLWSTQVFSKIGGVGRKIPWHQDAQYIPVEPLETCTVWLALDDVDNENGCLRVIPGSHKSRRIFEHEKLSENNLALDMGVREANELERRAVDVALKAGQMVIFDVMLVHGSEANCSSRRRAGIALRYMPSTSVFERNFSRVLPGAKPIDYSKRPIWLCRGIDRSGRNDFVVGHM